MMPSSMSLRAPARCRSRTFRRCARLFGLSGAYTRNSGLLSYAVAGREDIVRANRGSGRGERKRPDARRGREAEARVLSRDALGQHCAEHAKVAKYAHDAPSGPGEPEERQWRTRHTFGGRHGGTWPNDAHWYPTRFCWDV
jgi:hypothetical protein